MKVKTHTFRLGKYNVCFSKDGWDGICEVPSEPKDKLEISVLEGNSQRVLRSQIHESLHAEGIPDKYLHDKEWDVCDNVARFLWRLGWKNKQKRRR